MSSPDRIAEIKATWTRYRSLVIDEVMRDGQSRWLPPIRKRKMFNPKTDMPDMIKNVQFLKKDYGIMCEDVLVEKFPAGLS